MKNTLTERAKHRLRLAARFLRREGQRFNKGEFYEEVLSCINTLNLMQQEQLRGFVDWMEEYEIEEQKWFSKPTRSRTSKTKIKFCNGRALHAGVSDAETETSTRRNNVYKGYKR